MKNKYDAMIAFHVRFDANVDNEGLAGDITSAIARRIASAIRNEMHTLGSSDGYYRVNFVESSAEVEQTEMDNTCVPTVAITFAGVQQWACDHASESRHEPNVFMLGRFASVTASVREWNSYTGVVSVNDTDMTRRARPFNVLPNEPGSPIRLPMLPYSTMRSIIERARNTHGNLLYESWNRAVQEETVDTLEGLFEDDLPIDTPPHTPQSVVF